MTALLYYNPLSKYVYCDQTLNNCKLIRKINRISTVIDIIFPDNFLKTIKYMLQGQVNQITCINV